MADDDDKGKRSLIRTLYTGTQALRVVVKDASRARRIAGIVAKHGFSTLLEQRKDEAAAKASARKDLLGVDAGDDKDVLDVAHQTKVDLAARAVALLEELGPTFVKFGQILSTRPDLIPGEYVTRLQALQDHVSTVPVDEVRRTITLSLGKPIDELFATFDDVPIASASIAQVHGATLKDGTAVVVKVQRPGLKPIIEADLSLLAFLVEQVLEVFPEAESFDLKGMLREFQTSLRRELDFEVERQSLERFRRNFKNKPRIHIPAVFAAVSSSQVLVMERIHGKKLTAIDGEVERKDVAGVYLDAAYQMLFKDGFFHGDLHPGNVFVEADGRLGLIDFGMVGRLSRQNRERMVDVLFSLMSEDLENVARLWFAIGKPGTSVDYGAFEAEVVDVLERHIVGRELDEWDLAAFFRDLAAGAVKHGIRLPSDFTMMFKAMVTTEGLARTIAAGINPIEAARPYIEELVHQRYSLDRVKQKALVEGVRVVDLLWALPSTFERIIEKLEAGDLRLRLRHDRLEESSRTIASAVNRAGMAVIAAAGAVTGALSIGKGPAEWMVWFGLSPLSFVAFAIAFASTTAFFFSMWRSK